MTTSGVYVSSPDLGDIVVDAFERIQIRQSMITSEHMTSARRSLNFMMTRFDNLGINLWAVDLEEFPVLADTLTYNCEESTVTTLDVYRHEVSTGIDILLAPLSRTDYASIPNKEQTGVPTSYWFNRQTPIPTITIWQGADESGLWTIKYYRMRQLQYADPKNGQTADIPIRFAEALCAGTAAHLAMKWKPESAQGLMAYSDKVWAEAASEDRERVPLRIAPDIYSYYS